MYTSSPPPSAHEVDAQIGQLQAALGRLGTAGAGLADLADVADRFGTLRAQYAAHPRAMEGSVPRLSQLRQQFETLLATRLVGVVDRFHELGEQIRRAEPERNFLRQFFIRRAGNAGLELTGECAWVTVKARPGVSVPAAGTADRQQLDKLLLDSGHWPDVSQLARARLLKALEQRRFTSQQQEAIARLCPKTMTHQVISRPREQ